MAENEEPYMVSYGKGIKIVGIQLRVIKKAENMEVLEEFTSKLLGEATVLKRFGEPTNMYMIDRELDLDIQLVKGAHITTNERMMIHDQAQELYRQYAPWEKTTTNAMFQFHLEDVDGVDFYLNTGGIKTDEFEYIIDDIWTTVDVYQGWVDSDKESTSGTE